MHRRPDLELAGVWVHSPEKVGREVGGTGIIATSDADELIAQRPDCVVYSASGPEGAVPPSLMICAYRRPGSTW